MENKKYISFIFDDGPREPMCEMVDKFKQNSFSCGFAIIGCQISDQTEYMLKYAIDNGCELCSHSHHHQALANLDKETATKEMLQPIAEVEKRLGYKIKTARTPYLQINDMLAQISTENNLPFLGQGIPGAFDWESTITPEEIAASVIDNIYDGAVITFHVTKATCKSLDIIFPALKQMSYDLVTPSKLFEIKTTKIPLGVRIDKI